MSQLPRARGEVSQLLLDALAGDHAPLPATYLPPSPDALADEDLQLALYLCYELHYRGLPGVADEWEWEPSLLALDPSYGAYLDRIPAVTLATVNLMSWLGLHRRLRAAIVGHLALFEMTSSIPNRRYANGLRRLGFGPDATRFFDEHVTADAVHENIAAVDLAGGLLVQEPESGPLLLWGAEALDHLEARWAAHLISCWENGSSSLLPRTAGGPETRQLVGAVAERLHLRSAAPA